LRLENVAKRYGIRSPWVVRDVSLEIQPGSLVRFEGRNGSGKSTILRVIAGVSEPSRGGVTGRPVTGYVPERFPPALPFPARDYLSHIGRVHGLTGERLESRIESCLDRLGGRELGQVPLRHMSKGMCQKVAVAQALLPGKGLLVLDEAWTGLDVAAKAALDGAVAERLADGGSVVYVDHEPGRLAHLDAERWRLDGSRATRIAEPDVPGPAVAGSEPEAASPSVSVVVIDVAGRLPDGAAELPGVLSVRRDGEAQVVRVQAADTDNVLRGLLAGGDEVRIVRVDHERAGSEGSS
jgi:ABC-2 type transport system ATP-binding protein